MKLLGLILLLGLLTACGGAESEEKVEIPEIYKQDCDQNSELAGLWDSGQNYALKFPVNSCFVKEISCQADMKYHKIIEGKMYLEVISRKNDNPNCPHVGQEMLCDIEVDGTVLNFDCGEGLRTYTLTQDYI